MFNKLFYKTRSLHYARPFSGWWANLRFYWYTRKKGSLIFVSIFGLTITTFGIVIYYAIAESIDRRNLTCLALNVFYEARSESRAGQYAVAKVTLNRVASNRYPDTICEVVYQRNWDRLRRRFVGAFSWTELESKARLEQKAWQRAWEAAEAVYYNPQTVKLNGALFYHAKYIKPSWAKRKKPVARIGKHIFYK